MEKALEEFREKVQDLKEEHEDIVQDIFFLRWLKKHNLNVKKAEKAFRETCQWRKAHNLREIMEQSYPEEMFEILPVTVLYLKNGLPALACCMGNTRLKDAVEKFGKELVYSYYIRQVLIGDKINIDWNLKKLQESGQKIHEYDFEAGCFLCDYKDFSLAQNMSINALSVGMQLNSDSIKHFPLCASKWVGINCSKISLAFVNIMKKILEGPNLSVTIFGIEREEWQPKLLELVDADKLPINFGGNAKVTGFC